MVAIEFSIATVIGVLGFGEVIVRRGRRSIPVLILDQAHPCEIMQDRQVGVDELMFPEEQNARIMRLWRLKDDKELLLRDQERVQAL